METFEVGDVVVVKFPFSDLSNFKLRPALILFNENYDYVLCQITSQSYNDSDSIKLLDVNFISGSLNRTSYIRPFKLFTANNEIITRKLASLNKKTLESVYQTIQEKIELNLKNF